MINNVKVNYSNEEKEILNSNQQIRLFKDRVEPFWKILTTEDKGLLFEAIVNYAYTHELNAIEEPIVAAAFDNILNGMVITDEKYLKTVFRNRGNGSKHDGSQNKPQEARTTHTEPQEATGSHTDPVEPNATHEEATTTQNNPVGHSGLNKEPSENDWDFTGMFGKPQEARETESNPQEAYKEKEKEKETGTDTGTGTDRGVGEDLPHSEDIRLADRTAVSRVLTSMCNEYNVPHGKRNRLAALVEAKYNEGLPITRRQIEFTVKNIDAYLS